MSTQLIYKALSRFLAGAVVMALLLFLPAGSLLFWQGWLLMGILFIPMLVTGVFLLLKNPELLRKRLCAKETENEQKAVVALTSILFLASFVIAGLNWRHQWFLLPSGMVIAASVLFVASYLMYAEVLRENSYLSRTVEVQEQQKVIDTGLYGIIRHPMYTATTVLFLTMPLVLGSFYSFLIMLLYIPLIVIRIRNEESVLGQGLDGYREYKLKVKYRLLPFIW